MSRISIELPDYKYGNVSVGEAFAGNVTVELKKPLWVRQVKVSFIGKASVSWKEYKKDGRLVDKELDKRYNEFADEEIMHMKTIKLWPTDDDGHGPNRNPYRIMPAGEYEFKFSFLVPKKTRMGLPNLGYIGANTDDDSGRGHFHYSLEARVVRPMFREDLTYREDGIVFRNVFDLNTDPRAYVPIAVTNGTTIRSRCCCSGRIDVSIKLPKTGYAIDEFLGVWIEIVNRTSRTISDVRLGLIEICEFRTRNPRKFKVAENDMIAQKIITESVLPGQTKRWLFEGFLIPDEAKTSKESCHIMKHRHQLDVDVFLKGLSSPIEVHHIPILIGTVPLTKPAPDPRSNMDSRQPKINRTKKIDQMQGSDSI